jgi:hypothetical protein
MLKEIDLEKNSTEDIREVLDYIAYKLTMKQKCLIEYIEETKEYYSDGVDEELIDMIKGE